MPAQPFALDATPVTDGEVLDKWNELVADVRSESEILAQCRTDAAHCPPAAKKFLDVVRQDAAMASAAINLVLSKPGISSQAVDNLNASIHIRALLPDVLVKGADWALEEIVGRAEVEAAGGHVVRIERRPGFSTTALVEHILNPSP